LTDYVAGRWKVNALYNYDLSPIPPLIPQGRFNAAETELKRVLPLLKVTRQSENLSLANELLVQIESARGADKLAAQARAALLSGDYSTARDMAGQAQSQFEAIAYIARRAELAEYSRRATELIDAHAQLDVATDAIDRREHDQAHRVLIQAAGVFQRYEDERGIQQVQELLVQIERQENQSLEIIAIAIGAFAAWNILARTWSALTAGRRPEGRLL
jgi:hypothetical protein